MTTKSAPKPRTHQLPTNKAQARVAIAKDVIKWVRSKKIKPTLSDGYLTIKGMERGFDNFDVKDKIVKPNVTCNVCAKGALLTSYILRYDQVVASDLNIHDGSRFVSDEECCGILEQYFSRSQLETIEAAYEGWGTHDYWLVRYPDSSKRLIAMMNNIIKNNGRFKHECQKSS